MVVIELDALLVIEQSSASLVHDTPMPNRQVERFCSSETRQEIVVQESMHGEIEQVSSSGDAQRCKSSTRQMAMMTEDSVIQVFLEMLDSECLSTAVRDTSLCRQVCRQESEHVGSEDAQLCVSLMDS